MSRPTVSILTTCFNRAQYIGECIESVQQSKFQDYEHIIVDDQSSDDSVEIAKSYAEKDSRIQVYVNEKNLGDYPNRNRAAELASGTYLKYLDADDKPKASSAPEEAATESQEAPEEAAPAAATPQQPAAQRTRKRTRR